MIESQKSKFALDEDVTYLNCAYMGPMLRKVVEVGQQCIKTKLNPSDISVEDFFSPTVHLRKEYAELINCPEPNRVVTVPSVSYGIANTVNNLTIPSDSRIIIVGEQFPSNAYPWFRAAETNGARVEIITAPDTLEDRGKIWNEKILNAIDENTSVVALPICHWADGTLFDLSSIRKKTNLFGSALIIDGTQSVGAMSFDWKEVQPDALICAGYKWMLGGYSLGLACYGPKFDDGVPIEENWINRKNSEDFAGLVEYEDQYQPGSLRYEVGEHSNFILLPMLLESLKQIRSWGPDNIQEYCKEITTDAIERLGSGGYWIEDEVYRGHHLFGIRIPESINIGDVKNELADNKIFVSYRGTSIRVAPHLYNTKDDLQKLADCLLKLL
jgi:selenocysteine lyase/cysteine desulfurase